MSAPPKESPEELIQRIYHLYKSSPKIKELMDQVLEYHRRQKTDPTTPPDRTD